MSNDFIIELRLTTPEERALRELIGRHMKSAPEPDQAHLKEIMRALTKLEKKHGPN